MYKSFVGNGASHCGTRKANYVKNQLESNVSLVNCDNKTNHCDRYLSDALLSGQNRRKLSIDDESSHPINGSNTNNKIGRKRNINMLNDEDGKMCGDGTVNECGGCETRDDMKRMKVDGNGDGQDNNKSKMYQIYQPWVVQMYGDQSKSKTITLKKQSRIVSALKGLETNRPDSSKFRFWVKSKGFMTELPASFQHVKQNQIVDDGCLLFIPSKSDVSSVKRVAVVEYFFNIIFKVHCSVGEGEGRHVGQKRTYRKITECYAFLPREAVTKFLTQCSECRRSMKSTIVQEISTDKQHADEDAKEKTLSDVPSDNQLTLSEPDYPKNIENYFVLLKSLYENSSLLNRIKDIQEQSCERKFESFKENIIVNQAVNNGNSNQQHIPRKNININIKNELDNSSREACKQPAGGERSLGNIIINSLDVSINVAGKRNYDCSYGDVGNVTISCSTSPKTNLSLVSCESLEQLVTSSSSEPGDDEIAFDQKPITSSTTAKSENNNLASNNINDGPARAVNSNRVDISRTVPDDTFFDYHNMRSYDNDKHTTCNNNSAKYSNGDDNNDNDDNDEDYRRKAIITERCNKQNNSTGDIRPITSTYLLMTRSMGLTDEDALNLDSISSQSENNETMNLEDSYANLLKDADKLKLMLLAWNYQNSAAVRNGTSGPDLATMTNLWEQYQNALGISSVSKSNEAGSPSPSHSQEDVNSPSDNKEEDEESEDESDERMNQSPRDPERLKAFNMFVRMFVDENLDRMIPISKQPKEKVQAIIDSCARQFPDFSERARKRLRTYLKSCRRNKKTKDGWENQPSRPTPAHLTSVQAEQLLSIACENESLNAKRMRIGLEPISQSLNIPQSHSSEAQSTQSLYTTAKSSMDSLTTPLSISTSIANCKTSPIISTTTDSNANSINSILSSTRTIALPTTSPYDFSSAFMQKTGNINPSSFYNSAQLGSSIAQGPTDLSVKRPLLPHNLNVTEAVAVKSLITGYREAAAFLLRSADELEQLLLNQQQ